MTARTPAVADLYHGTWRAYAQLIAAGGFRSVDAHAVVDDIARRHDLPAERVRTRMQHTWGAGRIGDELVYHTTHPERAASSARRGPEVAHFALRATYALLHDDDQNGRAAAEWAKEEAARADDPAVLPSNCVADRPRRFTGFTVAPRALDRDDPGDLDAHERSLARQHDHLGSADGTARTQRLVIVGLHDFADEQIEVIPRAGCRRNLAGLSGREQRRRTPVW